MLLLRDRSDDLTAAEIRPFGISRDSTWSHASWAMTLGVTSVPLLSDWNGEAVRGFGVAVELRGMDDVAARSAFLIEGDTVRASWMFETDVPDLDAVIDTAARLRAGEV